MRHLALAALLVACGSHGDDAGDAGVDTPPERGTVTVHVVDKLGAPLPDLHVVFIDTDSTQTDIVTDAEGIARAEVSIGASATAERASSLGCAFALTTLQQLVPGDDVTLISGTTNPDDPFTNRVIPADTTPAGNFTINFPSSGGAQNYRVYTPCGPTDVGTTTSPSLPFTAGCARSPMTVVVLVTSSTGLPQKYAELDNVTFAPGGSATVTDTWHDIAPVTASYTNTTTKVTRIELERYATYLRGLPMTVGSAMPAANSGSIAITTPMPAAAIMRSRLLCASGSGPDCVSTPTGVAQQTITQTVTGTDATYALDVGGNLLPWISGNYDPDTTTMQIQTSATMFVDVFEANLRYYRKNSIAACTNQYIYTWRVFGPMPSSVTFPTLPSTLPGDPTVRPSDTQSAYQLYLGESDAINGWREAIKNVYEALGVCEASPTLTSKLFTQGTLNRLSQWN